MLTYAQDTIRRNAAIFGRQVNNWLDCDVIQEAILELEGQNIGSAKSEVRSSLGYLFTAISYRATKKSYILDMQAFIDLFDQSPDVNPPQDPENCHECQSHQCNQV